MVGMIRKYQQVLVCLLLILSIGGIEGCSKPKTSYDYLVQARKEHQNGNDRAAIIDLKNALQKDPKNGEARYLSAQILNARGEGAAAEIEIRKAVKYGVSKGYVAVELGKALLQQQQYQKILDEIAVTGHENGKAAAGVYIVRGDAFAGLRKTDDAKAAYERALKEYPDSSNAYLGMARLAALQNDINEALHQTELALSKDAKNADAWLMKAKLLSAQSKSEDARAAYQHALEADKFNLTAHLGLAALDLAEGKVNAAHAEITAAQKISPNALVVKYAQALIDYRQGKFRAAQDTVQEILKVVPDNIPSIVLRGAVSLSLENYEQAVSDLGRVVSQYPGYAYGRRLLAASYLKLHEPDKALTTLRPLLNVENVDLQTLALAGEAQLQARNFTKATDYLQQAIKLNPQAQELRTQLAISRLGAGDTGQAMRELEDVANQVSGQSPADLIIIVTYMRHREFDAALKSIENLQKKLGANPITYNLKGLVFLEKKDVKGARKAFEESLSVQPTYVPAAANLASLDMVDDNPDKARARFEAILAKDKNNTEAMFGLAQIAAATHQEKEYLNWLERAAKSNTKAVDVRSALISYYFNAKRRDEALTVAQQTYDDNQDNPAALQLYAATQVAVGNISDGLASYQKLVEMSPYVPDFYLRLALAQLAANQTSYARASLNKALQLQPDFLEAQDALIRLNMRDKKGDEALRIARRIESQRPDSPLGYNREGDVLIFQKQARQAIKPYGEALKKGGGWAALVKLWQAYILAGDDAGAERRLTDWTKQHPKYALAVRASAAEFYLSKGRPKDAVAQYEEMRRIAPKNVNVLNNLALLYLRTHDGRALATAEDARKLAPEQATGMDTVGWILLKQGQPSQALDMLRQAVAKMPDAPTIRYHYAAALARNNKSSDARKELQSLIASGEKFAELDDARTLLKELTASRK